MNKSTVLPSGASFNNLITSFTQKKTIWLLNHFQFLVKQTGLFNTLWRQDGCPSGGTGIFVLCMFGYRKKIENLIKWILSVKFESLSSACFMLFEMFV